MFEINKREISHTDEFEIVYNNIEYTSYYKSVIRDLQ